MSDPPGNVREALGRFQQVLASRSVPAEGRPYFVMWVKRLDAFRVPVLKRPFRSCSEEEIAAFVKHERRTAGRPDRQLKQAAEAVVLSLRQVVGRPETDLRRLMALLDGNAALWSGLLTRPLFRRQVLLLVRLPAGPAGDLRS